MLFRCQPDQRWESSSLAGHQHGLDDSTISSQRILVVEQIVSGGPVMPLVLYEPYDLCGYFAATVNNKMERLNTTGFYTGDISLAYVDI